jgi:vesicle coat complex subunit
VLALRKALGDDDLKVRQTAALGLANVGARARELGGGKELFDTIASLLKDKDAPLRRTAAYALGQIGSDDPAEFKSLAAALKDTDAMVRSYAVQALGKYAKDVFAEDADRRVQFLAAQTLTQQKFDAVEALTKVVEEGKGMQRLWAAAILGEIGPGVFDAIPALEKMAKDSNADARRVAMAALQKIMAEK